MPNWHATVRGNVLHLVHSTPDDELDRVGSWEITLWRGAPSWDSDPELEHAALGVMLPALHKGYIRHAWVFDIPDRYQGVRNTGDDRQWMTLQGGSWTIVLRFPPLTPAAVFAAVAAGFHAQLGEAPMSPVLAEAIAAAKTDGERIFLEHLNDGAGGIKALGDPQEERRRLARLAEEQAAARPAEAPICATQAVRHDTPPEQASPIELPRVAPRGKAELKPSDQFKRPLTPAARAAL